MPCPVRLNPGEGHGHRIKKSKGKRVCWGLSLFEALLHVNFGRSDPFAGQERDTESGLDDVETVAS